MHRAKPTPKLGPMEKKIPTNPKYSGVGSKIDSGNTVNKIKIISNKEYLKRRDELFKRIEPKWLFDLFQEYEQSGNNICHSPPKIAKVVKNEKGEDEIRRIPLEEVNHGPRIVSYEAEEDIPNDQPYLLLDVRTPEQFEVNRIFKAQNFPASYLNRDRLTPDLIRMKNKDGCLIIVYGENDQSEMNAANTFVQKGFDNIYLLSGGIIDFADAYPDYIEGIMPDTKDATKSRNNNNPPSRASSRGSSSSSITLPSKGSAARSTATGKSASKSTTSYKTGAMSRKGDNSDVSSIADSMGSNLSIAETIISKAAARKAKN